MPRRFITVLTLLVLAVVAVVAASPAGARVPRAPRSFGATIEPETPYVGQTSCDPVVRRGTAELGRLLASTYPGTSWASAYQCGTDGSQSEHYEGRAIDWMVSARNTAQRAEGYAVVNWLLATDRFGNAHAMARRLGVMYIIWNGRMWGSWSGKWEEYMHCLHAQKGRAYDNSCHRTHVHLSLSWNGARGLTTFWTGGVWRYDYGPCKPKGKKYAPKWTHRNFTACPGTWG